MEREDAGPGREEIEFLRLDEDGKHAHPVRARVVVQPAGPGPAGPVMIRVVSQPAEPGQPNPVLLRVRYADEQEQGEAVTANAGPAEDRRRAGADRSGVMKVSDWDEYGFTYLFVSPDEARMWVRGLIAAYGSVNLVCRIHDTDYVPTPGVGEWWELCGLCEREHRPVMRLTIESEAWCFLPPGERFPD